VKLTENSTRIIEVQCIHFHQNLLKDSKDIPKISLYVYFAVSMLEEHVVMNSALKLMVAICIFKENFSMMDHW
jgi:hypothetical protein